MASDTSKLEEVKSYLDTYNLAIKNGNPDLATKVLDVWDKQKALNKEIEAEKGYFEQPASEIASDVGRVAAQPLLEVAALTNMILGLPQFVTKSIMTMGGTIGEYERGNRDSYKKVAKERFLDQVKIMNSYTDTGKKVPSSMIDLAEFFLSQTKGKTLKQAATRAHSQAEKDASWFHPDKYAEMAYNSYKEYTGHDYSYNQFKKDILNVDKVHGETAVGLAMEKLTNGLTKIAESGDRAGLPKELGMSILELGTLYAFPKAVRATKVIADVTGTTNLTKRVVGLSDAAKDQRILKNLKDKDTKSFNSGVVISKKGGPELFQVELNATQKAYKAAQYERELGLTGYHPITKSRTRSGELDYSSPAEFYKSYIATIKASKKELVGIKVGEASDISIPIIENILKYQKITDLVMGKKLVTAVHNTFRLDRGEQGLKKSLDRFDRYEAGEKIKFDALEAKLYREAWAPMKKTHRNLTVLLERLEKLDPGRIVLDPKKAGYFQSRMYMQKANTWLEGIKENLTGRGYFKNNEAVNPDARVFVHAATEAQNLVRIQRMVPDDLINYIELWREQSDLTSDRFDINKVGKFTRLSEVPLWTYPYEVIASKKIPGQKYPDELKIFDYSKRRPKVDKQGNQLWGSRDANKEFNHSMHLAYELNVFSNKGEMINYMNLHRGKLDGEVHPILRTKPIEAVIKRIEWYEKLLKEYHELNGGKIESKKSGIYRVKLQDALLREQARLERHDTYYKGTNKKGLANERVFKKKMDEIVKLVEGRIKHESIRDIGPRTKNADFIKEFGDISEVPGKKGVWVVTRYIKDKQGKLLKVIDRELTRALKIDPKTKKPFIEEPYGGKQPVVPGESLNTASSTMLNLKSQRTQIQHATRKEAKEWDRNADGTAKDQITDPFVVLSLKIADLGQALRDAYFEKHFKDSPWAKEAMKERTIKRDVHGRPLIKGMDWRHSEEALKKGDPYSNQSYEVPVDLVEPNVNFKQQGMPKLEGLRIERRVAETLEDVLKRRDDSIITSLSNAMIRNMLLNPLPHIHNEIIHLVSTAGLHQFIKKDGIKELKGFLDLAWEDVLTQSPMYIKVRQQKGPLMSSNIVTEQFFKPFLKKQQDILFDKNSPLIKEIAKATGRTMADTYGKIADNVSRKGMWMARDIMYIALVRMKMKKHNLKISDAIRLVDAHMPTYRLPPRVGEKVLGATMSRILSKGLQDPRLAIFSRYKHGMVKSGLNTIRDISAGFDGMLRKLGRPGEAVANFFDYSAVSLGRTKRQQLTDGLDSAAALVIVYGGIYAMINAMLSEMLGSGKEAHVRKGGILHLIDTIQAVGSGRKGPYALYANLFTLNPVLMMAAELGMNTTFYNGRNIYDFRDPMGKVVSDILSNLANRIPQVSQANITTDDTGNFDGEKWLYRQLDVHIKSHKQVMAAIANQKRKDSAARNRLREEIREDSR